MAEAAAPFTRIDLQYKNLLLTGFVGVGKSTIARHVARKMGVELFDLDEEIELRELMSIAKLREQYGDSRLKALENDYCHQASLMRRAVLAIPGASLLEPRNFNLLAEVSLIVCLTCELGEALRRLHLASEQHYRDPAIRRRTLSRLRRDYQLVSDPNLLQLDTTHLSIDEEADLLVRLWATGQPEIPPFRMGPPPPLKPPVRQVTGLSREGGKGRSADRAVSGKQSAPPRRRSPE